MTDITQDALPATDQPSIIENATVLVDGRPVSPFHFNQLLAVVDEAGADTGTRVIFVGLTLDATGRLTGEAHVTITNRGTLSRKCGNVNIMMSRLRPASEFFKGGKKA